MPGVPARLRAAASTKIWGDNGERGQPRCYCRWTRAPTASRPMHPPPADPSPPPRLETPLLETPRLDPPRVLPRSHRHHDGRAPVVSAQERKRRHRRQQELVPGAGAEPTTRTDENRRGVTLIIGDVALPTHDRTPGTTHACSVRDHPEGGRTRDYPDPEAGRARSPFARAPTFALGRAPGEPTGNPRPQPPSPRPADTVQRPVGHRSNCHRLRLDYTTHPILQRVLADDDAGGRSTAAPSGGQGKALTATGGRGRRR